MWTLGECRVTEIMTSVMSDVRPVRVSSHLSDNITGSSHEESFATPGNVMLTRVFVIAAKTRIKDGVSHEWNIRDPQTPTVTHWLGFLFSNIL